MLIYYFLSGLFLHLFLSLKDETQSSCPPHYMDVVTVTDVPYEYNSFNGIGPNSAVDEGFIMLDSQCSLSTDTQHVSVDGSACGLQIELPQMQNQRY